ncbi:unnamed protein product [Mycena citricolor]|uniref:Glycoside hydrolase family 16 protein n=1 Tax=Mycena citricolor TaxID=2018698 RepID=A0AAD2HDL5_9AGAR|nr:unnamed protein product [Mycena citricolor]
MPRSATFLGLAALAASASASSHSFKRVPHSHARHLEHQAPEWKRTTNSGTAYFGFQNGTQNACGTHSSDEDMIVGLGSTIYGDLGTVSDVCFQHITMSLASDPSKSVDLTVVDACAQCGAEGNTYISPAAFKALNGGSLDAGELNVVWSFGSAPKPAVAAVSPAKAAAASTSTSEAAPSATTTSTTASSTASSTTSSTTSTKAAAPTTTSKASLTTSKKPATTTTKPAPTTSTAQPASTSSSEGWKLTDKLEGQAFLDFFHFDSGTGDNGGNANYVNGVQKGLAYTQGNQVVLAVDTADSVAARNSIRMVSDKTFNAAGQNLFIFDIAQMPAVCGTWPAVWFTGANWPTDGEIDVVEGVSLYNKNIYSIHTGSGCSIASSAVSALADVTIVEATGTNCDANSDPGACGFTDKSATSFGPGFNKAGGGVFALEFSTDGIKNWFFQAGSVPSDITARAPTPSKWGAPRMAIPVDQCSPEQHFKDIMMVVDTNLGGSFTEGVWSVDGAGGQATSCAKQTGFKTAKDYVLSQGHVFGDDAKWIMNGFYVFNK